LAQGGGKYRCGKCRKVCNALDALFDDWPDAGERPPAAGDLPTLGLTIDLEGARKSRLNPDAADPAGLSADTAGHPAKTSKGLARFTWVALALVIAFIILAEYAEFEGRSLGELTGADAFMNRVGLEDTPAEPPFRDLGQLHLVSRELRSHPFRPDALRLSATIVNRAPQSPPYPDIEVILLDASGEPLSTLRFSPADYLARDAARDSGMTPGAFLPLTLDLPDPGSEAVGFELNFL